MDPQKRSIGHRLFERAATSPEPLRPSIARDEKRRKCSWDGPPFCSNSLRTLSPRRTNRHVATGRGIGRKQPKEEKTGEGKDRKLTLSQRWSLFNASGREIFCEVFSTPPGSPDVFPRTICHSHYRRRKNVWVTKSQEDDNFQKATFSTVGNRQVPEVECRQRMNGSTQK